MLQLVEDPKKLGYSVKSTGILSKPAIFHMNFPNTWEILQIVSTILAKTSNLTREKSQIIGIGHIAQYLLANSCNWMWIFKVKNVKLQATTKSFIVAIFYRINPAQNTKNITEITKNSLSSVPYTYFKIGEKFSHNST